MSKVGEGLGVKQTVPIKMTAENCGGKPSSPNFYRNPQFVIRAVSGSWKSKTVAVRISFDGPADSFVLAMLTQPHQTTRVLYLTNDMMTNKSEEVRLVQNRW